MKTRSFVSALSAFALSSSLSLSLALSVAPALHAQKAAGRTVEIGASDDMKYTVTSITAKPGETLHIVVKPTGTMPRVAMAHNFVLLKAGADPVAFANAAAGAQATNYIPASLQNQVLTSTKLAGNGETADVTFKAPAKPGSYTYLCTFPGHFLSGMKGVLVVK